MRRNYSLDDKYRLEEGLVYMTGIQALVRLPIEQMRRDATSGLKTGAFISGYEGSPLGGYDLALQRVKQLLVDHNIHFIPGVNEDLAATAVMGSQTFQALPGANVDGVVGIWYGKGPGVDRSGDIFRHANLAGTGKNCGALALAGDDHVSKSSTIPHQSELSFYNTGIPTLSAGNTQEVLDYGLYGIAMSRFSGAWSALKLATDVCDGGGTVEVSPERCPIVEPELKFDGQRYEKTMNPMLIVPISLKLEHELHSKRLVAAREFARANGLNRITVRHPRDRVGIVTAGKSYYDLMSALRNMGIGEADLAAAGVRVLKMGLVFPIEPRIVEEFIEGLEQVVVIEEKRSFLELQLRELLYNANPRPAIYGKRDQDGNELFRQDLELDAEQIAKGLGRWLANAGGTQVRLAKIAEIESRPRDSQLRIAQRTPGYCSGCPHNRSTLLLEDQIAGGGIGCHGMAARQEPNRGIAYIAQMGGEGAAWIGTAPFTDRKHIFQNLGDGTYFHSGRLAVNATIAAGVNITFKVLFNGAVAMTGGQEVAGGVSIPALTKELEADGASRIVVLTEDMSRYENVTQLADMAEVRPREDLERTLKELEKQPGASFLIYDQMCAAEKRRRRNRGKMPQPERRLMINERVCEGCGDCIQQSNCVSLRTVETEFGPKTRIHQSSCNSDYTCALGDCPSFVSVMIEPGSGFNKKPLPELPDVEIEEPSRQVALEDGVYHILMPGIGGTGVVTIGALLAHAALIEGKYVVTLDQTGLAQKGGAVVSHLSLSAEPFESAQRVSYGATDLLLGFDVIGAANDGNLRRADAERTVAVVNSYQTPTQAAVRQGLTILSPESHLVSRITGCTRGEENLYVDASKLVESLFGNHMQTNIFLLGVAYQAGRIPIGSDAIEQAIQLNGVQVDRNIAAFRWGRQYVASPNAVTQYTREPEPPSELLTLDGLIAHRFQELTAYQNTRYAERYRGFVEEVRQAEQRARPGSTELTEAAAKYLYKLMAYKDEYEVARLLTDGAIERQAAAAFAEPRKLVYHLHPPLLRALGLKQKLSLGPWFRPFLKMLASFKGLRGTPLDVFGWASIRREERALIAWYRDTLRSLLVGLSPSTFDLALEIAHVPEQIRGYEEVKMRTVRAARQEVEDKLAAVARRTAA